MSDYAVRVKNITKEYNLYESEMDRLKESFHPLKKGYHKVFYALKDVNIDIKKGEKVGIIGANGAGKSTLLKIITGVLNPSGGDMEINGRVAALLELGAGFNPDYTGAENIGLNGMLQGLSAQEINERREKIIEFADIGEFINQPVKNYSSGMFVRLAFATQIFSDPDILIVDEALSVGDIRFQQKCYRAMDSLMKDKTVVMVTHDTAAVTRFCERVIWLNHGEVAFDGDVDTGLNKYKEFLINEAIAANEKIGSSDLDYSGNDKDALKVKESCMKITVPKINQSIKFKGNRNATILECGLFDEEYRLTDLISPLQKVKCIVRVKFHEKASHPILGLAIRDRLGNDVIAINTQTLKIDLPVGEGMQEYEMNFTMPELNHGQYTVTIAIANGFQDDHVQLCWADDALLFQIPRRNYDVPGTIYIERGEVNVYGIDEQPKRG